MSENGIIHQEKKFEFPDVIIELWKLWTEYGKTGRDNPRFYEIFDCLKKYLSSKICLHKKYSSRENWEQEKEEKEEFVENFLFSILYSEGKGEPRTNPCPKYQECEEKYIVKNLRKFVTKKRNPTEYELRNILRGTLHSMKKNMEVSVIPADEKYYNNETIFCLPGCESNALGTAESYDSSCIDTYFIEPYNIDERKKEKLMLQPAKARKLILQILHAFHGSGKFKEIVKCAKDHISNSGSYPLWGVIPGSIEENMNNVESNVDWSTERNKIDTQLFTEEQMEHIAADASSRIWKEISKISNDNNSIFCLYYLPKHIIVIEKNEKIKSSIKPSKYFGATSTVNDMCKKFDNLYKRELKQINGNPEVDEEEVGKCQSCILEKIEEKLKGRCTEIGKNPNLYTSAVKK